MELQPKLSQPGAFRKLAPYAASFVIGVVALAGLLGVYAWENKFVGKSAVLFFARSMGFDAFLSYGESKTAALRAAPGNYFRAVEVPKVVLDIKFENWQKILAKRSKALSIGGLFQEADDFVPASIRYSDGEAVSSAKVKIRLKGDHLDHLEGKKWSFRVKARGKDHVWGMRRFSLQTPETRNFQLTPMILALTKSLGLATARYSFVDVTINGKHIGVMALEEHSAKEMLEASARKASVIIRYSEKHYWTWYRKGQISANSFSPFNDYRFAPIDAFQSSSIAKSPVLARNFRVAAGLLRSFARGRLPASEVFDPRLMGRFLAVSELFGAWHGLRWHNLRFYFNPQTSLLEPLPYDMSTQLRETAFVTKGEAIARDVLRDERINRVFRATLAKLIEGMASGEITKLLGDAETRYLPHLQKEYLLLGSYPIKRLVRRASMLNKRFFANRGTDSPLPYDQLVLAREYAKGDKRVLALLNTTLRPIIVKRVYFANCTGAAPARAQAVDDGELPLTLPPGKPGQVPEEFQLRLVDDLGRNCEMRVESQPAAGGKMNTVTVDPDAPGIETSPIPASTVTAALQDRDFLSYDGDTKELRVAAGDHTVGRDLIVPTGVTLAIPAGTTLRFAATAIVAHGPVKFTGTAEAPIVLRPADDKKGWQGIAVVRAGARSAIRHTRFIHTTGVAKPGWTLTGGVTFYESDVDILAATFNNHDGEDALNIVRSDFTVAKTAFDTTLSDAFDSDFSTGSITDTSFTNIGTAGGGDAIDTSGSKVEINGVTFHKVSDKSISAGEASTVTARDVTIEDTGTGLASKDRSTLTVRKVVIRGARFAPLTAYIKKPEYGGATIIADDVSIEGGKQESLVQLGSRIVVAGNEITAQALDIDALYDTVMKKGAP